MVDFKVVVHACYGAYFVAQAFKYLGAKFCFRETYMMLLLRILYN